MNAKKIAYLLAFSVILSYASPALAAKTSMGAGRYFIKSKGSIWKNGLSIRHKFDGGFTADLSDWQLRVAKLFGVEVVPVVRLSILPTDEATPEVLGVASESKTTEDRVTPTQQIPWGVEAVGGVPVGGNGVVVAVLDTGVEVAHADLSRRIVACKDFTSSKVPFADDACDDRNGHGTHVAGIIAADGGQDSRGILGVAPEAQLMAFKVCDVEGVCFADDVAVAIRTAVDDGAHIITMSVGVDVRDGFLEEALSYAKDKQVLVVAAAGNDGPYAGSIDYPAAYPSVVSVGAVDSDFVVSEWSSRGSNLRTKSRVIEEKDLEFVAPGVNIESTWKDGGYAILSGTSMAAPHIAGLAARLWDVGAKDPVKVLREKLYELTDDLVPAGEDDDSGYGFPSLR